MIDKCRKDLHHGKTQQERINRLGCRGSAPQ